MVLGERKVVADSVPGNNGRNYVHVTAIAQVLAIKQQYEFTRDLRLYAKKKGFDDQSIISGEKSKLILGTTNVKARQVFVDIELLRAWLADVREPKRLDNEKAVDVMSKITVISQKKKKSVAAATPGVLQGPSRCSGDRRADKLVSWRKTSNATGSKRASHRCAVVIPPVSARG